MATSTLTETPSQTPPAPQLPPQPVVHQAARISKGAKSEDTTPVSGQPGGKSKTWAERVTGGRRSQPTFGPQKLRNHDW